MKFNFSISGEHLHDALVGAIESDGVDPSTLYVDITGTVDKHGNTKVTTVLIGGIIEEDYVREVPR